MAASQSANNNICLKILVYTMVGSWKRWIRLYTDTDILRWWLPGSRGFEAIANEAIRHTTNIHLLHHVISVYAIIKMVVARAKVHCLVIR